MRKLSINEIATLTGFDRSTVRKALVNLEFEKAGRSHLYNSEDALPLLYSRDGGSVFDMEQERARLTHHQANNEALKERETRGELISTELVLAGWQEKQAALRSRLLPLPVKVAPLVVAANGDRVEIEETLKAAIYEALEELAGEGIPDEVARRLAAIERGTSAAADA